MTLDAILRESRYLGNKSQEYMAMELRVARKTVQNWERGISSPSAEQAINWFRVLGVSPLPYLLELVFPNMENISPKDEDKKLRAALEEMVSDMPMEGVRELLYLFYGDHGSSPRAVLNMLTAHLHTPMRDRVTVATIIEKNYNIAERKGQLVEKEHVMPDMDFLHTAILKGEEAFIKNEESYVMSSSKNEEPQMEGEKDGN